MAVAREEDLGQIYVDISGLRVWRSQQTSYAHRRGRLWGRNSHGWFTLLACALALATLVPPTSTFSLAPWSPLSAQHAPRRVGVCSERPVRGRGKRLGKRGQIVSTRSDPLSVAAKDGKAVEEEEGSQAKSLKEAGLDELKQVMRKVLEVGAFRKIG